MPVKEGTFLPALKWFSKTIKNYYLVPKTVAVSCTYKWPTSNQKHTSNPYAPSPYLCPA